MLHPAGSELNSDWYINSSIMVAGNEICLSVCRGGACVAGGMCGWGMCEAGGVHDWGGACVAGHLPYRWQAGGTHLVF